MPHYPFKPAKEVLIDMINQANDTAYSAVHLSHGAPVAEAAADGRNTRLPVVFGSGALANGAIDNVYYKRLDFDALFGARVIELTDEGFTHTVDLLPLLFDLYGVVIQADDVVNEVLGTARPLAVTVQANPNSLMYIGEFDLTVVQDVLNWKEPISVDAIQLFDDPVSPFNGDWFPDTTWKSEGTYSLRSADIGNNQTSSTEIDIVDGTGKKISFDYRVSSEATYDFLRLFVNGTETWSKSGAEIGSHVFSLPSGAVNVEWRYTKDETDDGNLDTAWIDKVRIFTPVPFTGGILASHSLAGSTSGGGTVSTTNLVDYEPAGDADAPRLWNSNRATWAANGPNEIIAIDGSSNRIDIHASFDGNINWIKRSDTTLKLASNESVFFKGKLYFIGQLRSDSTIGVYRLDRTGTGESTTFTAVRVLQLTGGNGEQIAADENTIAVFDGSLRYSSDAVTWNTQVINHPYATGGVGATMYRMQLAFAGGQVIGLGKVNSLDVSAPSQAMFIGTAGGTYTWKRVEPWGAGVKGDPTQKLLKAIGGNKLLLTVSEPQGAGPGGYLSSGDTILSNDLGDSWVIVDANHGIYPMSIADDGTNLMITGFRQRAGQFHWQATSQDRAASWQHDTNESSFFGVNQTDYTFALGIPPVTP